MSLYTIGDTHLSFGCDKPMNIFKGWHNHVERLEENWQSIVKPEDTVVIVGDISWGMNLEQSKLDFEFLHRLNGKKIIMKGNHDYWFTTKAKIETFWQNCGLDTLELLHNNAYVVEDYVICGTRGWINDTTEPADERIMQRECGRLEISLKCAVELQSKQDVHKEIIVCLHYPPMYYVNVNQDMVDMLNKYNIKRCYYGHIHGDGHKFAIDGVVDGINYQLVSCDYTQFKPIEIVKNCTI